MMKTFLTSMMFFFILLDSAYSGINSNTVSSDSSSTEIGFCTGYGFTWYKNNMNVNNFYSNGFDIGVAVNKSMTPKISLETLPLIGVQFQNDYSKRALTIIDGVRNYPLYLIQEIDDIDKVLATNHYFVELPIYVKYKIISSLSAGIGIGARLYLPFGINNELRDFTQNTAEYRLSAISTYSITERFSFSLIYNHSLNRISSTTLVVPELEDGYFGAYLKSRDLRLRLILTF